MSPQSPKTVALVITVICCIASLIVVHHKSEGPIAQPIEAHNAQPHISQRPTELSNASPSRADVATSSKTPTETTTMASFQSSCTKRLMPAAEMEDWSGGALVVPSTRMYGEGTVCTRGADVYRIDHSNLSTWGLAKSPLYHTTSAVINDAAASAPDAVVWHKSIVLLVSGRVSMFHLYNDVLIPLYSSLRSLYHTWYPTRTLAQFEADFDSRLPIDPIMMRTTKPSYGKESEVISNFTLSLIPPQGREVRLFIPLKGIHDIRRLYLPGQPWHCYCRALLQPAAELFGPMRRDATLFYKQKMNRRLHFLPFGTLNVPEEELDGASATGNPGSPRLVFFLRNKSRLIYKPERIAAVAREIGFRVTVMTPEQVSLEKQARAARYADVLMAMHGQALTWVALMDSVREPHCRELVELTHFGKPFRRVDNVYETLAHDNNVTYRRIVATDVVFPSTIQNPSRERKALTTKRFPHFIDGFHNQTAIHDLKVVRRVLEESFRSVKACLDLRGG